jgi:hypothetical protein
MFRHSLCAARVVAAGHPTKTAAICSFRYPSQTIRSAWTDGTKPQENRNAPPLTPGLGQRLSRRFPQVSAT